MTNEKQEDIMPTSIPPLPAARGSVTALTHYEQTLIIISLRHYGQTGREAFKLDAHRLASDLEGAWAQSPNEKADA